jgi:D-lactate dehydrogenase (cytochrome)
MKRDAIAPQKPLPDGLVQQLTARFGPRFSMVPAVRDQHGRDESPYPLTPPDAVVFAQTTEEVQDLVKACAAFKVPIIPFGAGSSVEGHVLAFEGGVAVDLTQMNQVLAVHQEDLMATVQAGVTRNQLNQEIRHTGLFFPIDPGADATLGGMSATRASGTNAVRYGTMRENVVSLTVRRLRPHPHVRGQRGHPGHHYRGHCAPLSPA